MTTYMPGLHDSCNALPFCGILIDKCEYPRVIDATPCTFFKGARSWCFFGFARLVAISQLRAEDVSHHFHNLGESWQWLETQTSRERPFG